MKTTNSNEAWRQARAYFNIENQPNLVLHHKDEMLRHTDVERYNQWNPEDLVVLTREEHASIHHKNTIRKPCSDETKAKISAKLKGVPLDKERAIKAGEGHNKQIICLETGEVFKSVKATKEKYGRIEYALKTGKTVKGLTFKYIN